MRMGGQGTGHAPRQKPAEPARSRCASSHRQKHASDFADEMRMEYRLASRMIMEPDFAEGVRAVLIDKDNAAALEPRKPEGISEAKLDAIFAPLPPIRNGRPYEPTKPSSSKRGRGDAGHAQPARGAERAQQPGAGRSDRPSPPTRLTTASAAWS